MKMSGARRMTIGVFAMAILAISNARLLRIITKIVDDQPSRWDWRDDVKDFAALRPGLPKNEIVGVVWNRQDSLKLYASFPIVRYELVPTRVIPQTSTDLIVAYHTKDAKRVPRTHRFVEQFGDSLKLYAKGSIR